MRSPFRPATMLAACLLGAAVPALGDPDPPTCGPTGPGRDETGIQWLYDSPLSVEETITVWGDGWFLYTYDFVNVDEGHIWGFMVYPRTSAVLGGTPPQGLHEWDWAADRIDNVLWMYDARNLDPGITMWVGTWAPNFEQTRYPINPGEYAHGFSYIALGFDDGPKVYAYETIESGWAAITGYVAAVGFTPAGPTAARSGTWGQLKALYGN